MKRKLSLQAMWSDWGKQSKRSARTAWGGRRADGGLDSQKPMSFFGYVSKHKSVSVPGKSVLKYPTAYRRDWDSYGKKYNRK